MYRIGHKKRNTKHHIYVLSAFVLLSIIGSIALFWFVYYRTASTSIKQTTGSKQLFNPGNDNKPLKIDTDLYTMQLPSDWKQIATNEDTRYNSIKWEMQSGAKNRWLELYTDRLPTDTAFNRIITVNIIDNVPSLETVSDNCSGFTPKVSDANLKVPSRWQGANFLCDLSNATDNVIGVSDKATGTALHFTGPKKGLHTYMFVYTDRGIPEDESPIITAIKTLLPK
ncbi:MAG: hypothetical protein JWO47_239 [Candidatus Saccharibacteria bacterium]|nr:hypothetical protein [Candidatus Saccharibacteria bacterium]